MSVSPHSPNVSRLPRTIGGLVSLEPLTTKVLLVDGSRIDAERSRMELRRAGVANDFYVVSNPSELSDALRSFAPDIVISELIFPGFDADDVQRVIRELRPDTPLIFISFANNEDGAAASAARGAADYVSKASLFRLPAAVQAAVRESRERAHGRIAMGATGLRSRQHAERLEAIWRVVNFPEGRGPVLEAVIGEAAKQVGRGLPYFGMLGHIEGAEFVLDTVAGDLGPDDGAGRRLLRAGMRGRLDDVIHVRDVGAGRTNSWDDIDAFPNPPAYSREAGLRSQITTQFHAAGVAYMLTLGSLSAPSITPFDSEDYAYVEVVASIVARQIERERHERSLRNVELGSRRHAERLDAIWRIVNSTNLRGDGVIDALLREGAAAMRPGEPYVGTLGHIDGDDYLVDAVAGEPDHGDDVIRRTLAHGMRCPRSDLLIVRDRAAERTQSWEDCQLLPDLPARARAAGIRSQIATQFNANDVVHVLSFATLQPPSPVPFSSQDYEYIEVLGSVVARQLELEAMETSLRDAESRSQRHTRRLDALWHIVNESGLSGGVLVQAILNEAIVALYPGRTHIGVLRHVEGSQYVIDATAGEIGPPRSPARRLLTVGTRIDFADTVRHDAGLRRTQMWDDLQALPDLPMRPRTVGWRSVIATSFEAAGRTYELTLGSFELPSGEPFASEDAEYVEVVASVLARQLDIERMEGSLDHAESRARQHAERLEALWRVVGNPALSRSDAILAMMRNGAAAIRVDRHFGGLLHRVDGDEVVVVAVDVDPAWPTQNPNPFEVGSRRRVADTLLPAVGQTRMWDDIAAVDDGPRGLALLGWRAAISTSFEAGGSQYALAFGSPEPNEIPFGPDDVSYLEVLAASFANRLQVDELERSLSEAEERSRHHAERLESLWQIINNSNLRDDELLLAMLRQAAVAIQPGQAFEASLLRAYENDVIVEAVAGPPDVPESELHVRVGDAIPLETTLFGRVLAEGGGTRSWDDVEASEYSTFATRARGTRSVIISTFAAGVSTWGLSFTSTRTARKPLDHHDRAYIEVVASFFANHLQQRWQFDRIQYQQSHDVLTGLLNRSTFRSRARMAAVANERYAVIMIDVDGLHEINESYGHIIGDAVLVEVGNALLRRAADGEIVGRFGGDVFGIYVPEPESPEHLFARVIAFSDVFAHPFSTGDREGREFIARTACIGVAAAPENGTTFEAILARADAALFTAQERGYGSTVFYVAGMEAEAQRRAALQNELREAIAGDQFTLHYQPHVEIASGRVTGCEALIRWNHPTRGPLLPAHFIPFAEKTGLITSIDAWVMRTALATAAELSALRPGFRLYFNLSGRQAGDPQVVRAFIDAARAGVPLGNIGVEITETDAMRDVDSTRHVCRALRRLNVRVAIDDFGTGYSSLSSLKRLPVDVVKIDRTFIAGVLSDRHDATITETIVSIADHFGFETLAEGAEHAEEIAWLGAHGCRYVQGFGVCHPLPLDEFKAWLAGRDA